MTFSKYRQESRPLFLSLGLLNIHELNTYMIALFKFEISLAWKSTVSFMKLLFNGTIHMNNTGTSKTITHKLQKNKYGTFLIKNGGAKIWNSLHKIKEN